MNKDEELEKSLLGRLVMYQGEIGTALEIGLRPEHFSDKDFKEVFEKMEKKYLENSNYNITELDIDMEYLSDLSDACNIINTERAVADVINNYKNRELNKKLEKALYSQDKFENKISEILKMINDLDNIGDAKNEFFSLKNLIDEVFSEEEEQIIPFPYSQINEYFTLEKESLVTVGARPGVGKTAFALNLAYRVGKNRNILYVNLEMGKKQIRNRIWGIESRVNYYKIDRKTFNDEEAKLLSYSINDLRENKMQILDCQDASFEKVIGQIKRKHEIIKFDLIIIDYLTLLRSTKNLGNRNNEVEYMANRLKSLAKELDTCIMILAQLNRVVEGRSDKRPILSDLRDSGGIEQASNVVAFLHREDYYNDKKGNETDMEFIIRKNRNGKTGTVHMRYNLEFQKIVEKNYTR